VNIETSYLSSKTPLKEVAISLVENVTRAEGARSRRVEVDTKLKHMHLDSKSIDPKRRRRAVAISSSSEDEGTGVLGKRNVPAKEVVVKEKEVEKVVSAKEDSAPEKKKIKKAENSTPRKSKNYTSSLKDDVAPMFKSTKKEQESSKSRRDKAIASPPEVASPKSNDSEEGKTTKASEKLIQSGTSSESMKSTAKMMSLVGKEKSETSDTKWEKGHAYVTILIPYSPPPYSFLSVFLTLLYATHSKR
jgi:hypothetical protein